MTILAPGTFKVSDYRKDIPAKVKTAVRKRYRYDHRPALQDRPYDTGRGDFIPPQHDPACIDLIEDGQHDFRTFGRVPGAEKTVTTRGSDAGNRKLDRKIKERESAHQDALAAKGEKRPALPGATYWKKKRELQSRWPSRKLESRNSFKRRGA
jgi:hypothetical protein